jgi:hypothetical protein
MINDTESLLAHSLDSIDGVKRRAYATFALSWIATFIALLWFTRVLNSKADIKEALSAAVVALVFAIFLGAFSVMFYVTRMTKRIIRAISLLAPPSPNE